MRDSVKHSREPSLSKQKKKANCKGRWQVSRLVDQVPGLACWLPALTKIPEAKQVTRSQSLVQQANSSSHLQIINGMAPLNACMQLGSTLVLLGLLSLCQSHLGLIAQHDLKQLASNVEMNSVRKSIYVILFLLAHTKLRLDLLDCWARAKTQACACLCSIFPT